MRLCLVIAVTLLGCSGSRATGPAWPKMHAHDDDGGESLAPRERVQVATQLAEDEPAPAPPPRETPLAPVNAPAQAPPASAGTDDSQVQVMMTEEVIEIKDDE